jgi:glycosyltransferase involved in cell wall biosynthesis
MTRPGPLVSIGVPVYNGERYLGASLDSLLAQTFADFELIVCDNASTDLTEEIGREYAARDPRVRYVRNAANLGLPGNYRRTFEFATGKYFRWAAADDLSGPEFLARCVEVLDTQPGAVLAYPKTKFIDEDGRLRSEYEDGLHLQSPKPSERFRQLLERLQYVNVVYGVMPAAVIRRMRSPGAYCAWDVVFLAELSLYGTFWEVPEFLFYRRFHAGASSNMDGVQISGYYGLNGRRQIFLREWRHLGELACAVARAPLDATEKLRATRFLGLRAIWNRDKLVRELLGAMRELAPR